VQKRFYIIFVAREQDGRLRKIPIPLHYALIFVAAALVGAFSITGMAGSYTRMLVKTADFNQMRSQHESLRKDYAHLEALEHQKDVQAASLGSLASEVAALYMRPTHSLKHANETAAAAGAPTVPSGTSTFTTQDYARSLDEFAELRTNALAGHLSGGVLLPGTAFAPAAGSPGAPDLWPVLGRVTSSFGEREDPFNGEGAFHAGIDIATGYGTPIHAPADGVVDRAGPASGYGRVIILAHAGGLSTVFGHLSGFAVTTGQAVKRGEVIGYVGSAGRSTGPHLHYEVRIHDTPVNPHKYLRGTLNGDTMQLADGRSGHGLGSGE
jgi:murein DD-endopeptidase MepM/ murein hydrolase activator NlpD